MRFFRKPNKDSHKSARESNTQGQNQRVYTYYTASRRQIDQFERSNQSRHSSKRIAISDIFGSKIIFILAIIVTLLVVVFSLTLTSQPALSINGSQYRSNDTYSSQIEEILKSDIRNYFKLSLQRELLEREIASEFPEVASVSVTTPLFGRVPIVKITTNNPFAILLQKDAPSYVIDNAGKNVININETVLDTASMDTIKNQSGINFDLNNQVFKPEEIESLLKLDYQLTEGNSSDAKSSRATYVLPEVPREIRLQRAGYYAKFSLDNSSGADIMLQYGALITLEKSITQQGIAKPKEYIDVRLGDKAYIL